MNTAACEKEAPSLSRDEAIAILDTPDEELEALIDRASSLRYKYKGNRVSIHILTNARSGNCSQDCAYCAQSCRSKADIEKYKWVDEEKLYHDNDFVNEHHLSRHCIGLSGMKFTDAEIEELARRIRKMKEASLFLLFVWISRMKQLYCVTDYLRYKYFGSPFSIIWETSPWISGCE